MVQMAEGLRSGREGRITAFWGSDTDRRGLMTKPVVARTNLVSRLQNFFITRDVIFHDGRDLRRFSVRGRTQAALAGLAAVVMSFSAYGAAQAAVGAVALSGVANIPTSPEGKVAAMQAQVSEMQADVAAIKQAAAVHAARVDQRQALIAAVLSGKGNPQSLAMLTAPVDPSADRLAADVVAPLKQVEARQIALAAQAKQVGEQRYAQAVGRMQKLGVPVRGGQLAEGGPLIAADSAEAAADLKADMQFHSLFMTWKKLDNLQQSAISIPSTQPVSHVTFSSMFGVRSDPFTHTASLHPGVDMPSPVGTPVYATADGLVDRAERAGGYGNMVEIDHGKGIQTRYGHLSKILVSPMERVKRGQLIALTGSTGRSTGPHLHYEVRIDGHAVNPMPFLQTGDYLLAVQSPEVKNVPVSTGPETQD
jgi:murein DD-endopeptidase MepM/ murein hydrolase activator NlpD